MDRLLILVLAMAGSGACVAPLSGPYAPDPYQRRTAGLRAPEPPPIGRWDNVMMLAPGTSIRVLTMDGPTEGRFTAASGETLKMQAGAASVQFAARDVVRVDRTANRDRTNAGLRGAATGTGVVGVLGLLLGHAPPPRVWAAGAIAGAYEGAALEGLKPGEVTIYLADRAIVPTGPNAGRR